MAQVTCTENFGKFEHVDTNHVRWQKLHCHRTTPVEQFAGYSKTNHQLYYRQFRLHLKAHFI